MTDELTQEDIESFEFEDESGNLDALEKRHSSNAVYLSHMVGLEGSEDWKYLRDVLLKAKASWKEGFSDYVTGAALSQDPKEIAAMLSYYRGFWEAVDFIMHQVDADLPYITPSGERIEVSKMDFAQMSMSELEKITAFKKRKAGNE